MPRSVRSSYITGSADGVATPFGTGPRKAGGWLSADITLRTAAGFVSDSIKVTAGGLWHGGDMQTDGRADASAAAHAYITVPRTMRLFVEPRADGGMELHIVQDDDR